MRKHAWRLYYEVFRVTHDRMFIGQDHRVLRYSRFGPERLSPMDQDVVYWRKFAVRNARGYLKEGPFKASGPSSPDDGEEYNNLREAF